MLLQKIIKHKKTQKRSDCNGAFRHFNQEEEYEYCANKDTTEQNKYFGRAPKLIEDCLVVCMWCMGCVCTHHCDSE